jgi:hypothetical protein
MQASPIQLVGSRFSRRDKARRVRKMLDSSMRPLRRETTPGCVTIVGTKIGQEFHLDVH